MNNLLGNRLRTAREAKRLTQVQVKQYTNIHNKTLSGYEKGVSEPDIETIKTLAKLYETSVDYLVGDTDDPLPRKIPKADIISEAGETYIVVEGKEFGQVKARIEKIAKWEEEGLNFEDLEKFVEGHLLLERIKNRKNNVDNN